MGYILFNKSKYLLCFLIIFNYLEILKVSIAKEIETINPIIVTSNYYPKKLTETGSSVTVKIGRASCRERV